MNGEKGQVSQDTPGKKCTKCFRTINGHPKPIGKSCTLGPILSEMEQNAERQKGLEKNRKRMANPQNKEATRKRMATDENKDADRKRKAAKIRIESRSQRKMRLENKKKSKKLVRQRKRKASYGHK